MYDILLYLIAASFTTMALAGATVLVGLAIAFIRDEFF